MSIANTVQSYLAGHQVKYDLLMHSTTGSSHDTAQAAHVAEDHIAKAVMVKDAQGYAMVVIPASQWLKLQSLNESLDRQFELATEDEIKKLLSDCEPGAIPPLGPAYEMETFIDEQLSALANVYFEAGDHRHLVHVKGEDFQELLKGVRHGYFSH